MRNMIVSRNYRNPNSPHKWLVRRQDQLPHEARPMSALHATGVEFRPSTAEEYGFGCTVVAYVESIMPLTDPMPNMTPLQFDNFFGFFYEEESERVVSGCEHLILDADGSVNAVGTRVPQSVGGILIVVLEEVRVGQPAANSFLDLLRAPFGNPSATHRRDDSRRAERPHAHA